MFRWGRWEESFAAGLRARLTLDGGELADLLRVREGVF